MIQKPIQEGDKMAFVGKVVPNQTPDKGSVGTIIKFNFSTPTTYTVSFPDGTAFTAPYTDWITAEEYSSAKAQTYIALAATVLAVAGLGFWLARRK